MTTPRSSRLRLLGALAALMLFFSACSFVQVRRPEDRGRTFEEVSVLIADLQRSREGGGSAQEWWDQHPKSLHYPTPESWDGMLGALYAERSASKVRHNRYECAAGSVLGVWLEIPGQMIFLICGLAAAPFDVAFYSIWLIRTDARESGVPQSDLILAAQDILRARELGFTQDEIGTGFIVGRPLHVDRIGYDSAWLESLEVDAAGDL